MKHVTFCSILTFMFGLASADQSGKKIMVLGGNGYIGSEAVLKFVSEGYEVVCVNRGNEYWDSKERIDPKATVIHCDRLKGLKNCPHLEAQLARDEFYHAIVDFSAYVPSVLVDSLQYFDTKFGLYVYVSTDSVYEVCEKPDKGVYGNLFLKEEDAHRPESKEQQEKLKEYDDYGHKKLSCEEELLAYHNRTNAPYVIFRLPDVLGPRDSTNRWWFYQLWIQFYALIRTPVMVPQRIIDLKTSYVYVKDVGRAVSLALAANRTLWNNVYNLGYEKPMTLGKLIHEIQMELNVDNVQHDNDDSEASFYIYPSVNFGAMDVSKAKKKLGWTPTPWHLALAETIAFYNEAIWKFPAQRNVIIDAIYTQILPTSYRDEFQNSITKHVENAKQKSKKSEL